MTPVTVFVGGLVIGRVIAVKLTEVRPVRFLIRTTFRLCAAIAMGTAKFMGELFGI